MKLKRLYLIIIRVFFKIIWIFTIGNFTYWLVFVFLLGLSLCIFPQIIPSPQKRKKKKGIFSWHRFRCGNVNTQFAWILNDNILYSVLEKVFQMVTRTSFINLLSLYFYFSKDNNEIALKIRYNRCLGVSHQVSYKAVGFVIEHKTWMCNIRS